MLKSDFCSSESSAHLCWLDSVTAAANRVWSKLCTCSQIFNALHLKGWSWLEWTDESINGIIITQTTTVLVMSNQDTNATCRAKLQKHNVLLFLTQTGRLKRFVNKCVSCDLLRLWVVKSQRSSDTHRLQEERHRHVWLHFLIVLQQHGQRYPEKRAL